MESFEDKWREALPSKYRKASPGLLTLWNTEKKLSQAGQFEDAAYVREKADNLKRQEYYNAQNKLNFDYIQAKNQLNQKHEKELQIFDNKRNEKKEFILARQKRELIHYENRKLVLKTPNFNLLNSSPHTQSESTIFTAQKPIAHVDFFFFLN